MTYVIQGCILEDVLFNLIGNVNYIHPRLDSEGIFIELDEKSALSRPSRIEIIEK